METLWTYHEGVHSAEIDLSGFDVEATDGSIGSVDESTAGRDHLVVDTGFWIFGKRRLLPAGVVRSVDIDAQKVFVNMTKDQIKQAPDLDIALNRTHPDWDRTVHSSYYGPYVGPF